MRRTPECALHVHVGMPERTPRRGLQRDAFESTAAARAVANSPMWFGQDSGLRARGSHSCALPAARRAPRLESLDDYASTIDAVAKAGDLSDYTYVWWDVRLHPRLGRSSCGSSTPNRGSSDARRSPPWFRRSRDTWRSPLPPSARGDRGVRFRASRDGIEATLLDGGELRRCVNVAARVLEDVSPAARELGGEEAAHGIERMAARAAAPPAASRPRAGRRRGRARAARAGDGRDPSGAVARQGRARPDPRTNLRYSPSMRRRSGSRPLPCEVEVLGRGRGRSASKAITTRSWRSRGSSRATSTHMRWRSTGERRWPRADDLFRRPRSGRSTRPGSSGSWFGSCRVAVPHEPPYT